MRRKFYVRSDASRGTSLQRRIRTLSALERKEEAKAFLNTFHDASGHGRTLRQRRWAEVRSDLRRHGYYEHTLEELAFGARLAWRNTGKCIGRLPWESLEVNDCRKLTSPDAMAARMVDHLREADSGKGIRSIISVFAPIQGDAIPTWIESGQISRYACHTLENGRTLGDRQNAESTKLARSMGWTPPEEPGAFDLLPYFMRDPKDRRIMIDAPVEAIRQVDIRHPQYPDFDALGLRWYAVPLVSNMIMTIGGVDYPCAPFNGHYMCTEIASRNLADAQRYDLLPQVARAIGISEGSSLWQDVALTELNRAVLQSFQTARATIIDHHKASEQFMTFHSREQARGRRVAGDWRWIVPPQAGSAHDVFHLKMRNFHPVPNFYRERGTDGLRLMPWYGDNYRNRVSGWVDRVQRRWKIWKRMAW
ncbi:nitric oxide synthase oxygenase [Dinoroseobacter sp. S375]|uniref:nitric oxide synthase oxygenase n=1 Tax=Dinoroseobacter sp. S375 TaxID=3415136 RepID=UPI003C7A36B5